MDPVEFYQNTMGLQIVRELPESLQKLSPDEIDVISKILAGEPEVTKPDLNETQEKDTQVQELQRILDERVIDWRDMDRNQIKEEISSYISGKKRRFFQLKQKDKENTKDRIPRGIAWSSLVEDQNKFARVVDRIVKNGATRNKFIRVGDTPLVLNMLGVSRKSLSYEERKIQLSLKGQKGSNHIIEPDQIKRILALLTDPVAVRNSDTEKNSLVVILDEVDANGDFIIAAIHKKTGAITSHKLASVYGKSRTPQIWLDNAANAGDFLYLNKKKALKLGRAVGVSFPTSFQARRHNLNLLSEKDLVKERETYPDFYQGEKVKRGSIQFGKDETLISLYKKANLSTFVHESGHFFFQAMGNLEAQGNTLASNDMKVLLDWVGVDSFDKIGVEHHEQFARGFEAYLFEGKAPSAELQGVFERFSVWLTSIYRALKNLDVELSDEVRGVMDRMLATEEEISLQQEINRYKINPDIVDLMTDTQKVAYKATARTAEEQANSVFRGRMLKQARRERSEEGQELRKSVEKEITVDVQKYPVYRAFDYLMGNKSIREGEDNSFIRLSKEQIIEQYGKDFLNRLPKGKLAIYQTGEDALDLQTAASMFGFSNANEMISALVDIKPIDQRAKAVIQSKTEVIMQARFADDPRRDGTAERLAIEATHNDARTLFLEQEINGLVQKTGSREISGFVLKQAARSSLEGMVLKNSSAIQRYMQAERKAARRSEAAIRAGNYLEALNQKEIQLFNYHLVDEAKRVGDEFSLGTEYLEKFAQEEPDKSVISAEYLQQIRDLLSVYGSGVKKYSKGKAIALLKAHNSWASLKQLNGGLSLQPSSPMITHNEIKRIRDMTLSEFRGLLDTVKYLEQVGGNKAK